MADDSTIEDSDASEEEGAAKEPKSSKAWLARLTAAEKAGFRDYHDSCDRIDKRYADLGRLASSTRDREFQIFWANVQVVGPSIYSRPPVPVVVPRFQDRRPLSRAASELLERCTTVALEMEDIDDVMRAVRDDLVIPGRGCVWIRYEAEQKGQDLAERVCIEHVQRKDFLHDPARKWKEVDWVAKRSWLTKEEMRKRFASKSGKAYQDASFNVQKDQQDNHDGRRKAAVWEIWCRSLAKVVWVSEGVDKLLDEAKPHLKLDGFFPCPRPAYATLTRDSLIPVPDFVFYKDQVEEVNELTARIAALTQGIKVRGFYPAGQSEIGAAINAAMKSTSDNQVLIPISNWALLGNSAAKDMIVWMPIDMIVGTVKVLIEQRKQLIDDVYQITGLSDIMRGATVASETLGAQQLKSQYGSIRIRDRQDELTRMARDIVRIAAEIMAEEFQTKTLVDMAQMETPTDAEIAKQRRPLEDQAKAIESQVRAAATDPEIMQMAQQNPEEAQKLIGQAEQQVAQLRQQAEAMKDIVTVEKIAKFLRDERIRPFVLDIETDSTIAPDENAQKQRATEYVTAVGGFLGQAAPLVQSTPQLAPVVAEMLKFVGGQFRAGRELQGTIEEFAEQMKQAAAQPPAQPDEGGEAPAAAAALQVKQQEMQAKLESDQKRLAMEREAKAGELDLRRQESEARRQSDAQIAEATMMQIQARAQEAAAAHQVAMQKGALEVRKAEADIARIEAQTAGIAAAALNASVQPTPTTMEQTR